MFNKACQVRFLAGRGQTKRGSHARLPGSSLMCCHKTCSWQRLNVQQGRETLGVALPTVPRHVSLSLPRSHKASAFWLLQPAAVEDLREHNLKSTNMSSALIAERRDCGCMSALPLRFQIKASCCHVIYFGLNGRETKARLGETVHACCQAASPLFNVQS